MPKAKAKKRTSKRRASNQFQLAGTETGRFSTKMLHEAPYGQPLNQPSTSSSGTPVAPPPKEIYDASAEINCIKQALGQVLEAQHRWRQVREVLDKTAPSDEKFFPLVNDAAARTIELIDLRTSFIVVCSRA